MSDHGDRDPIDLDDQQLEDVLRRVMQPTSAARRDGAIAAFGWRNADAELAALVADSRTDRELVLRDDGNQSAYQLEFRLGRGGLVVDLVVDLETSADGRLQGAVLLSDDTAFDVVTLRRADGTDLALPRQDGGAIIPEIERGTTFRIELQRGGDVVAVSEWIST